MSNNERAKLMEIIRKRMPKDDGVLDEKRVRLDKMDLRGMDLSRIHLERAILREANLNYAELWCAILDNADMSDVDMSNAYLYNTSMKNTNLENANLKFAHLENTDLRGANLKGANLKFANLEGANLEGANLNGASLDKVEYDEHTCFFALQCPEKGAFIGYKKAHNKIIELEICADAKRSSATTRKCRCSAAKVLSITNCDGTDSGLTEVSSDTDENFIYRVGNIVTVDNFNENRWVECSTGIHFFLTRDEAVQW